MTDLILGFSKKIELHLTSLTKAYVTKEINDIGESLNRESFFNLSSEPVSDDIKNNLKLGRKYIPFCKLAFKTELRKFDSEVLEILHRYVGFFPQYKNCVSVSVLFCKLKKLRAIKSDPEKLIKVKSLITSYYSERKAFIRYMKLKLKTCHYLPSARQFEEKFKLNPNLIIVAADKNLGYVCLDKTELINQYSLINNKQHFGKSKIAESWYLTNILRFINEASNSIPSELSEIVPKSLLYWENPKCEIGILRLMPKLLKLSTISRSNLPQLSQVQRN